MRGWTQCGRLVRVFLSMSVGGLVGWREMEGENVQVLDGECDSFRGECRHCHRLAYTPPSVT